MRSARDLRNVLRSELVDGVIVDLGGSTAEGWMAVECARDFPKQPFFAAMPLWPADAGAGADTSSPAACQVGDAPVAAAGALPLRLAGAGGDE